MSALTIRPAAAADRPWLVEAMAAINDHERRFHDSRRPGADCADAYLAQTEAAIARDGGSVLAILHDLNLAAAFADEIVVIDKGAAVAAGAPADVLTADLIRDVWKVEARIEDGKSGEPLTVIVKHGAHPERRATLLRSLNDLFPGAAPPIDTELWSGLRPMTPDGTPVVGPTPVANLFLNTGHGTLGWTMACGSARLIASLIGGTPPPIDADGLGIGRYST